MESPEAPGRRQRARMACEPCRERKRKCGGEQPCKLCVDFGYSCYYRSRPRKRRSKTQGTSAIGGMPSSPSGPHADSQTDVGAAAADTGIFARSLESNSGSAFVRTFAMTVDPTSAPPFQFLGHNLFLGERHLSLPTLQSSITDIVSFPDLQNLVSVYMNKVQPCYRFLDQTILEQAVTQRYLDNAQSAASDGVLCGVAALGCVFSDLQDLQIETQLVDLAKVLIDSVAAEQASVNAANAWILRTVYLRLTGKPEQAWMASCTTLHMIDAAGIHTNDRQTALEIDAYPIDLDTRRRMFGVARHLNIWLSFDLARSRVVLQNASLDMPVAKTGEYTTEILELLPFTESLDPGKPMSGQDLLSSLGSVLRRTHTQPPSVLAQCNLMLCLYRRLYTLRWKIPSNLVNEALHLIRVGVDAVHACIESGSPWHHVANIPFQSICALLAIDSSQSFAILGDAISCLEAVNLAYRSKATNDAMSAAQALVFMHQKRREVEVKRQSELLKLYPIAQPVQEENMENFPFSQAMTDLPWFNDLIPDVDLLSFDFTSNGQ